MNIIDYQKEVINLIDNSFKKNQNSHAYIFEGEKGSGLKEVAIHLAKMLLCYDDYKACDSTPPSRRWRIALRTIPTRSSPTATT